MGRLDLKIGVSCVMLLHCLSGESIERDLFQELEEVEIIADQELRDLWNSLDSINSPSQQDYEAIHHYLRYGRRAYLDVLFKHAKYQGFIDPVTPCQYGGLFEQDQPLRAYAFKSRVLQELELSQPDQGRLPTFDIIAMNCSERDLERCIVVYSSYNPDLIYDLSYTSRSDHLLSELKSVGFKGHLLIWHGGYPLLESGGIKLVHVPYSFKVLALLAAEKMGYKNVLWLDTSIHPQSNLSNIFDTIEREGYYTLKNGIQLDFDEDFGLIATETRESWGVSQEQLKEIDHIIATIIGVNLQDHKGRELLKEWYKLTSQVIPAMSLYPEEFLISVACWRLLMPSIDHVGYQMDVRSVKPYQQDPKGKPFWHDKS